ncbi:hypothetical protein N7481_011652 [Penicillium waksmanii]|uniref:uncharacterized protein n=1 Tax=Penicillium waksmanii TaxID=69791 RepID=UPI0025480FC2|nr:uncharacterized protein N7481_011652 [Penicillium waksmanii]KAJ5974442.1 hypothetical protein N7481_011652 [Penicillium waksmanii]
MIFSHLPIISLAKLMAVSRHFQDAVEPTLKCQLRAMVQRSDIRLMLLCACPDSAQSRVRCQFLQTPGLDTIDEDSTPRTTALHSIYRPEALSPNSAPAGPPVGSIILLCGGDDLIRAQMGEAGCKGFATRQVTLEDYESFIQLRVKLNLVIAGQEYFIAPAFVVHDGMIRIDRAWLERNTEEIIWMNSEKLVGLRMRAVEKEATEDEAKSFDLEIRELHVRSALLLHNIREAEENLDKQEVNTCTPETLTPLRRTRVACKACNARRVKCDAGDGQPCWHCRMRQIKCELIDSKRGKYIRKTRDTPRTRTKGPRQILRGSEAPSAQSSHIDSPTETPYATISPSTPSDCIPGPTPGPGQSNRDGVESQKSQRLPAQHIGDRLQTDFPESYTNDSSTLHYVIELSHRPEGGSTEPLTVHHPIPASIADRPGMETNQLQTPISLQEALTLPTPDILRRLIYTFFDNIHPAYPVFDREKFSQSYSAGQTSPLVLQTICLLGFTIGSDDLVVAAGFTDRATARKTHFLRAKALYDADYETDRMNLAAVLLLFGFWWASYDDQKDSRDRHTAGAFGRPTRIRDEDCDIEALTEEDFDFDTDFDQSLIPAQKDYHVSYVIEMAKLAALLGDILLGEFSPQRPAPEKFETNTLIRRLEEWESELPKKVQMKAHEGYTKGSFWGCMLQISYQNCTILLFRPKSIKEGLPAEAERDSRARAAADFITRLAEDLLATGMIHSGLIHMYGQAHSTLFTLNDSTDNYQGSCLILSIVDTYARDMPEGINPSPTRREQITTVHAGTERDSKVMAGQNLDLEGIRQSNEKVDRAGV